MKGYDINQYQLSVIDMDILKNIVHSKNRGALNEFK